MFEPSDAVIDDRRHSVGFYGEPDDFAASVGAYVSVGLRRGETVLLLVTADHAALLDDRLAAAGFDLGELRADGRYVTLDAHEVLDQILVDGSVDRARFVTAVADVVTDLAAEPPPLRIFGELVGVLWADGRVAAAIEIEQLWNDLQHGVPFALHCGYADGAGAECDLGLLAQVCGVHTALTTASWATGEDAPGPDDAVDDRHARVFLPTLTAPRAVRRFVRRVLRSWDLGAITGEFELVASELATNAVVHADSPFELSVLRGDGRLTLRVRDASPVLPARRDPDPTSPGGRGMGIIAELVSAWGVDPLDGGKVVWVELHAIGAT